MGVLAAPASAQEIECKFCKPCEIDDRWIELGSDFVSPYLREVKGPQPIGCPLVEQCSNYGDDCPDEGPQIQMLADLRRILTDRKPAAWAAIQPIIHKHTANMRYVADRRIIVVSTECSGGRPVMLIPVPEGRRDSVQRSTPLLDWAGTPDRSAGGCCPGTSQPALVL
jgi:hypothetical protein